MRQRSLFSNRANGMLLLVAIVAIWSAGPGLALAGDGRIRPYEANPQYWQYKGQPVLLLGASDDDNLFQKPDLEEHLDQMAAAGANYIRNTMSDRKDGGFEVYPFRQLPGSKYDLGQWNDEYWKRFENMLRWTAQRDIIVQIELWDRHDYTNTSQASHYSSSYRWKSHPYNPANNVNYDAAQPGLSEASSTGLFATVPALADTPVVLQYQRAQVDKILSHTLRYDHVLYCISNETDGGEAWSTYWAEHLRAAASEAGKKICITEMWNNWDLDHSSHRRTLDHLDGRYDFFEASQGTWRVGQLHWDRLQWARQYIADKYETPTPVHITKVYGARDMPSWAIVTDADAVGNWWHHVLGGAAATRFHRPPHGLGLSEPAIASLRAARQLESLIKLWDVEPANGLLSDREENEAYLAAAPGRAYALFFPDGGSVSLDLTGVSGSLNITWISVASGRVVESSQRPGKRPIDNSIQGGGIVTLSAPDQGAWVAALAKQ